MAGPFLTVCGHTNIDVQIKLEALPRAGQSHPVLHRRTVYGGTACNVARHAAGLDVPVRLWSRVGEDFPPEWRAGLEDDGVELHMDVDPEALTPTCYVLTDVVDHQAYCMDQGAMATMVQHRPLPDVLDGLAGWLHLCTGDPAAYMELARAAQDAGIRVALDPGQELRFMYDAASFEAMLERSDALFVNVDELDIALRYMRYGDAEQLLDHVDMVVVTRGKDGASLHRAGAKRHDAPAFSVTVVDPTGAGDALRAGWYAALRDGRDAKEALRWGQAAAAVAVQYEGPQDHVVARPDLAALL